MLPTASNVRVPVFVVVIGAMMLIFPEAPSQFAEHEAPVQEKLELVV